MDQQFNIRQAVPFFMVTNMDISLKFYIDGLGFRAKNTWTPRGKIEWCWLEREGVAVPEETKYSEWVRGNRG